MPRISVVMPVYNSALYLKDAIECMINQTYRDWELLAINEYDSNDGSAEMIHNYSKVDKRIILIQNSIKMGLAESLNIGIRRATGEFIARLDADDLSHRTRLEEQIEFMDANPQVGVCGTWQHHFGKNDWIHCPPPYADKCQTILLFDCNLCHSTVMIRKKVLYDHNLFYDSKYAIEDFEFWSRIMEYAEIINIPEVLGEYRESDTNISHNKMDRINHDSTIIVGNSLKRYFDIELTEQQKAYFVLFEDPFMNFSKEERLHHEEELKRILYQIFLQNQKKRFCNDAVMMHVLHCVWFRAKYRKMCFNDKIKTYQTFQDIFTEEN